MAIIEPRLPLSVACVEAFARFLVRRMANARAVMLHAGAVAQRRSHIERVFRKLAGGTFETRIIYRDLRLQADEARQCLWWMEKAGLVQREDDEWVLVGDARLSFNDCTVPILEA
jgi:hypothetical protein